MSFDAYFRQLGAFLAGALLAETNFRTQIEADIRPFRGLLLGLFFVTTGTSIDVQVVNRRSKMSPILHTSSIYNIIKLHSFFSESGQMCFPSWGV